MKRILSLVIVAFALFALTACGDSGSVKGNANFEKIDVDLTAMSDTVMYSMVIDMDENPGEYMGKTVKMTGDFASIYDEELGKTFYACQIQDETACCSQGLEFEPTEKPDDSLKDGSKISVAGVFDTYDEDGVTYCTLRDAVIL